MKLIMTSEQPPTMGLPLIYHEWWDLGDGYEVHISLAEGTCSLDIGEKDIRDVTYEVAKYLEIDTSLAKLTQWFDREEELYLSTGIDCAVLIYKKPECYKELLERIELILNKHFKQK